MDQHPLKEAGTAIMACCGSHNDIASLHLSVRCARGTQYSRIIKCRRL
jgi:hypothetical protein